MTFKKVKDNAFILVEILLNFLNFTANWRTSSRKLLNRDSENTQYLQHCMKKHFKESLQANSMHGKRLFYDIFIFFCMKSFCSKAFLLWVELLVCTVKVNNGNSYKLCIPWFWVLFFLKRLLIPNNHMLL